MISTLPDTQAVRILSTVAGAYLRAAPRNTPPTAELLAALTDTFGPSPTSVRPSDGDLARTALALTAADPGKRERLEAMIDEGPPAFMGVGQTIAVATAALAILQTEVTFERTASGTTKLKIHTRSATDPLLKALAHGLMRALGSQAPEAEPPARGGKRRGPAKWDGPARVNLADVLADLYPTAGESRRVVADAGLDARMIAFNDAAVINWFNILDFANKQDRVPEVISRALRDFPKNPALLLARERGPLDAARGADIQKAAWKATPGDDTFEKLVSGEDALVDVFFLRIGLQRAQAVARVVPSSGHCGTGFLFKLGARVLLMTNHHVLPDMEAARAAEVQFNYERTPDGLAAMPALFHLVPSTAFDTSEEHDWTAVAVAGEPEKQFPPIELAPVEVKPGDRVNIIQHPMGGPKQLSFFHNVVTYAGEGRVQYLTDTMPGSSGAPVFDKHWRVVALHHSGGWLQEPGVHGGKTSYRNEGIHIDKVLRSLGAEAAR